jgi:hypothetical protein
VVGAVANSIFDEAESRIDDAANRVMPHCGSEVELPVAVVTVEPIPVVVVGVRARRDRDRVGRGVDGEIVEWGKHRPCGVQRGARHIAHIVGPPSGSTISRVTLKPKRS